MKSKGKIFAILVALMFISAVPILVCNPAEATENGSLPSSFDLRDTYNNVTAVRNQGSEGLCWAFGMSAALEGEMINMGYDNTSTVLSPLYESVLQYDSDSYSGFGESNVLWEGQLNRVGGYLSQPGLIAADGKGPMYEYIAPYDELTTAYYIDGSIYDSSTVIVKQVIYNLTLPTFDNYIVTGRTAYDSAEHPIGRWDRSYSKR